MHFRQSFACGAQVSPAARHFAPFSHALARARLARRGGWRRRDEQLRWRCARLYLCLRAAVVAAGTAGTGHSGCAEREAGVTASSGTADRLQKGKSAQIAHAVGGSSTGVQHCRGLLLQAQGGDTRRRYRPGRRQQLDRPVSGSRVGPDTDQSSSALLARRAKGSAAGCGSC